MCLAEKFWRANSIFPHMFAVCSTKAHGKTCVCRVFDFCHTANARVCRVPNFHRVFHLLAHVKEARMSCAWSLPCILESDTRQKIRLPCAFPLPCAALVCTRQTLRLPGARGLAHGKSLGTRQTHGFR